MRLKGHAINNFPGTIVINQDCLRELGDMVPTYCHYQKGDHQEATWLPKIPKRPLFSAKVHSTGSDTVLSCCQDSQGHCVVRLCEIGESYLAIYGKYNLSHLLCK